MVCQDWAFFMGTDSQLISATAIIKKKIAKTSNDTLKKKEKKNQIHSDVEYSKVTHIWSNVSCICAVEDLPAADTFSGNHACQYRTSNPTLFYLPNHPHPCKLMTLKNTYLNAMEIYTKLSFINTLTNITKC